MADVEDPPDGNLQARLVAAWAESIATRGYARTTVRHIIALAHISRSTFYGAFEGKDDAFISIHRATLDAFGRRVERAAEGPPDWPSKVAVGMAAALEALATNSEEAQVLLGDPFAGPRLGYCHDLLVERFAPCLAAGREQSKDPLPPPSLEIGLLGSVVEIANRRLRAGEVHALPDLAPSLTEFVLTHYVGAEQAERAARHPAPDPGAEVRRRAREPSLSPEEFAVAFDDAFERLRGQIEAACARHGGWSDKVAASIRAAFDFVAEDTRAGDLLTRAPLIRGGGEAHFRRLITYLGELLQSAHRSGSANGAMPGVAVDATAGGLVLLVGNRLANGRTDELESAAAETIQFVLSPYMGIEEARRVAARHS